IGLCLLYWESRYDTSVEKRNSDGTANHGLFQISDRYWCQSSQRSPSINICQLSCNELRDDDIYDDVNCVLEMFHRHEFNIWPSSFEKCSGNLTAWLTPCHTFHQRNGYPHQQGYVPQNPHQPPKSDHQQYEHQYNRDYGSHGGGQHGGGIQITPNGIHVNLNSSPLSALLSGGGGLVNLLSGGGGLGSLLSGGVGGGLNSLLSSLTGKLRVKPFFKVYNTISLGADH
ncbi:uncharacterized protein LOC111083356, partial [Limulus polyphemus]|uniref:lysozyme n=1 Tax=Limulus polyphemus TaxID=6850 RepID=A0ABM1RVZ9_LIMPO